MQLKEELNMMRMGTAADKYRLQVKDLKKKLGGATSELEATQEKLRELEISLAKAKSKTCAVQ